MFFKNKKQEKQIKPTSDGIVSYRNFKLVQEKTKPNNIKLEKLLESIKIFLSINLHIVILVFLDQHHYWYKYLLFILVYYE